MAAIALTVTDKTDPKGNPYVERKIVTTTPFFWCVYNTVTNAAGAVVATSPRVGRVATGTFLSGGNTIADDNYASLTATAKGLGLTLPVDAPTK